MKLSEWEVRLHSQFDHIELIGELDVSAEDIAEIALEFREIIKRYGERRGLGTLLKNYHCTWMTFLVFQGVYGYSDGDYWTSVADAVGIRQDLTVWGRLFFLSLERFELPTFPDLAGPRYVTRILLHGGIPQSSLSNFFEHIIADALSDPRLSGLGPGDLIAYLLENSSAQYALLKPVHRFLTNGGRIAVDFVARCLDLASTHSLSDQTSFADHYKLPQRVVQAYFAWSQNRPIPIRRAAARLQRPHVVLDPYGDGIIATLPSQPLDDLAVSPNARWLIQTNDSVLRQPVRSYRRRDGWQTEEEAVVLSRPFGECRITFEDDRGLVQSWRISGIDSQRPILLFDIETGRIKTWNEKIPAGQYWLVYPQTFDLHVDDGRLVEDAGILPWDWTGYCAETWDLRAARLIELRPPSNNAGGTLAMSFPVEANTSAQHPWLEGGNLVTSCSTGVGSGEVYTGQLPLICIPVPPQRTPDAEVQRWQISVSKRGTQYKSHLLLADVNTGISKAKDLIQIDMVSAGMILSNPYGVFDISLRGHLGQDTNFTVVSVPDLVISGSNKIRIALPGQTLASGRLEVRCAPWLTIDSLNNDTIVEQLQPGSYAVTVPAEQFQAELRIESSRTHADGYGTEVYIQVSAPVLHWTLMSGQQSLNKTDWHTTPAVQPKPWLEQAERPQLIVAIAPITAKMATLSGTLSLVYQASSSPQILLPTASGKRFLRFELRELRDTVRQSSLAKIWGSLELDSLGSYSQPISLPVLCFSQSLETREISLQTQLVDSQWHLTLHWDSETVLAGRHAILWSLSRPWQESILVPIPDNAQNDFAWQATSEELAPGRYRLEMTVIDPWAPRELMRPAKNSPNCVDIELGSPEDMFRYASQLPHTVEGYVERIFLSENTVTRSSYLRELSTTFGYGDIAFVLDTLIHMTDEEGMDGLFKGEDRSAIQVLQSLLLESPLGLLQIIAERVPGLDQEQQVKIKQMLMALGICSGHLKVSEHHTVLSAHQLEMLWSFWPVLGTAIESSALVRGDLNAWNRANSRLGLSLLRLSPLEDDDQAEGELSLLPELVSLQELNGGPPEEHLLRLSYTHLRQIEHELRLVPSGLLPSEHWLIANLSWLMECKRDQDQQEQIALWIRKNIGWIGASFQALIEEKLISPQLYSWIQQRFTRRDVNSLVYIPFMVGVIALMLRVLAHDPRAKSILRQRSSDFTLVGVKMLEIAPMLLDRDLCLIELILAQTRLPEVMRAYTESD